MNLDPFAKSAMDPFKDPGKLNPTVSKDVLVHNSNKGGGLGRNMRKSVPGEENEPPEEAPAPLPEKPKPLVTLRNPRWEADKVGFNEETKISVEAEIPPESGDKKRVFFELYARTPRGPERISQGEGMADGGKAVCRVPVYIPNSKTRMGT